MFLKRKLLIIFLFLTTLCLIANAQTKKDSESSSLLGTEWVGKDIGAEGFVITYRFEANGVLAYAYHGKSFRNGNWSQKGQKLYFETNNKYSECDVTINSDEMTGECWNVAKDKWKTLFYRYSKPD